MVHGAVLIAQSADPLPAPRGEIVGRAEVHAAVLGMRIDADRAQQGLAALRDALPWPIPK